MKKRRSNSFEFLTDSLFLFLETSSPHPLQTSVKIDQIERNVLFIASDPSSLQQLSNAERKFVAEYASLYSGYLEATFTSKLPAPLQSLPSQMIKEPNLQKHVVMSVVDDMGDVMMDTGETVSLFSGSVLVARYQPLRSLIRNGRIDLL